MRRTDRQLLIAMMVGVLLGASTAGCVIESAPPQATADSDAGAAPDDADLYPPDGTTGDTPPDTGYSGGEDVRPPTPDITIDVADDYLVDDGQPIYIGGERPARVLLPEGYNTQESWPLVVLLHGYSLSGALQDIHFGMSDRRHERGFILVLPDGTLNALGQRFWNATDYCCDNYGDSVDDVTYFTTLLDEAEERFSVDTDRVYLVGYSNGAFMNSTLSCEIGARIAAMVNVAGSTHLRAEDCTDPTPVATLQVHATLDSVILYLGLWGSYPSFTTTVDRMAARNGCEASPTRQDNIDVDSVVFGNETEVRRWNGCDEGVSLEQWIIHGGGHGLVPAPGFSDRVLDFLYEHSRSQ